MERLHASVEMLLLRGLGSKGRTRVEALHKVAFRNVKLSLVCLCSRLTDKIAIAEF